MNLKSKIAKALTELSVKIAHKASGQVSTAGTHQPKEPKCLHQMK
ncbi:MAG: cyclic lactone autoinducer peptide [Ruminococcus sp.]|nr:cyclic lactone autoinducer peptide [Ruminococcus sp.]